MSRRRTERSLARRASAPQIRPERPQSLVAEVMASLDSPRAVLRRLNVREETMHSVGSQEYLLRLNGLTRDAITRAVLEAIGLTAGAGTPDRAAQG